MHRRTFLRSALLGIGIAALPKVLLQPIVPALEPVVTKAEPTSGWMYITCSYTWYYPIEKKVKPKYDKPSNVRYMKQAYIPRNKAFAFHKRRYSRAS